MKVGFIVECGPEGAETKVITFLAEKIHPGIETDVIPLDKKPKLKRECGDYTKKLLDRGCGRVLIVWDLLPDWGEYEGKGCQHDDRMEIQASLKAAGISPKKKQVRLVCIHKMLEAWLIADERAISTFLSTEAHPIPVSREKKPETIKDPSAALNTLFRKSRGRLRRYVDYQHAFGIAQRLPDTNRLDRLATFKRFREMLTGT